MISKPVYELIPYGCLVAGVAVILPASNWGQELFGLLLFFSGALIWIWRSSARRRDAARPRGKQWLLPRGLYEQLPFLCIAVALLVLGHGATPLQMLPAWLLLLAGCLAFTHRLLYRLHRTQPRSRGWG